MSKSVKHCPKCGPVAKRHHNARKCFCGEFFECPNCQQWRKVALQLAMLAAKKPLFFNPLEAFEAENVRDGILRRAGLL